MPRIRHYDLSLDLEVPDDVNVDDLDVVVDSVIEHSTARDAIVAGLDGDAVAADVELDSFRLVGSPTWSR